ncbi:MAG TPA: M48 family metalloprotease [Bryobacteraceae bacterium]|jgi:predicted Zn-dependent protease|nr:M48 family metalloprotease [Bryobacteraceae bacterium]
MMKTRVKRIAVVALACAAMMYGAAKQKTLKPGFNLFSKEQDVQMGQEYAAQVEREMPIVNHGELNGWLRSVGDKLTRAPEADKYPYSFKIVYDPSINAFALPGGPTFTHTGLITAADNESQVAGVLAHEISHVVLRHGTNQASKAQLMQLPAMLGGQLLGGGGGITGMLAQLGIGLGANSLLLKFSRNAESDADVLGSRIMHQAGYNPIEMARFFEKLEAESGKGNWLTNMMSDHPNPGNRQKRIQEEIQLMGAKQYTGETGDFRKAQQLVKGLPKMAKPAGAGAIGSPTGGKIEEARPQGGFKNFQTQGLSMRYPSNWEVFGQNTASVTIAPRAGLFQGQGGQTAIGYGVVINQQKSQSGNFERDTQALIQSMSQGNQGMRVTSNPREQRVDNKRAFLTMLGSPSPWGGNEVDWLVTVEMSGGMVYFVFIAPEQDLNNARGAFDQMIQSVRIGQ